MVINSPCLTDKKELAIPGQTATGKEFSNPLMAVDGKAVVISESSVRNDILFDDEDGITCLTNDDIFENLALMGYEQLSTKLTFQKVSHEPQNEANIEQILLSPSIYKRKHRKTQKHRRAKKVTGLPQTSVPLDLGADKAVYKEGGDSVERAITTDASLVAAHDSDNIIRTQTTTMPNVDIPQGMDTGGSPRHQETIGGAPAQTRSERVLKQPNEPPLPEGHTSGSGEGRMAHTFELMDIVPPIPHDSPLPGGYTPGSDEGRLKLKELMAMCIKLSTQYDTIQANIDADALFAARLQQEEREQFTIEERAQFLVETIAAQRKFRAAQRAVEIRSKPPTKTQLRNMMITYLKNMGKFNHNQLKGKSYEELQRLYEREQKWINDFVPMDSEKEEKKSVEPESEGKKGKRIKRVADSALKQKSSKKQKMMQEQESAKSDEDAAADYEHEKEELRMWLTVVPDEEETADPEILSAKYPIVDWESQNLGNVDMEDLHVYKIIKADRNTNYHKSLFSMLRKFDRQDLVDLHRLVMKRFEDNTPEGYNLLLWGDLKSSYIADGWYFDLLQHVSREKVSSHQGNAGEDVELEARS
ncbi:hypothetical protein Tco_0270031 [Tanacetum coccineum]